jgi:TolB protein
VRETAGADRLRQVFVVTLPGGEPRRILPDAGMQHSPAWSRDGETLAFTMGGEAGAENLWLARLDGDDERQLTAGRIRHFDPDVAPDGAIYVSSNRDGDYDIWRFDPRAQELARVLRRPGPQGRPRVSPDGRRVLFVSRAAGRGEIWVAGSDGGGARRLTGDGVDARDPVWLPAPAPVPPATARDDSGGRGGSRIAFLRMTDGAWQPWSARPDGSDLRRLATLPADVTRVTLSADGRLLLADCIDGGLHLVTTGNGAAKRIEVEPGGPTDAALSSDGARIAYSVNTLGGIDSNDLWIAPASGGRGRRITDQPYLQHFPSWGPDGDLVYLSGRGGQAHDVWRVSAAGGTPKRIVGDRLYNFEPAISPLGDVAFSSNRAGDYDIWVLRARGDEPERVTRDPAYDGQPTFSPDGGSIAFLSRRGGAPGIWIHDLESGRERPLGIEGDVRMPFWFGAAPEPGAERR